MNKKDLISVFINMCTFGHSTFYPLLFLSFAYLSLRYSTKEYETSAVIEIIDGSIDQEMALPTSMTIFNRS